MAGADGERVERGEADQDLPVSPLSGVPLHESGLMDPVTYSAMVGMQEITDFQRQCERKEYTDTEDAHVLLMNLRGRLRRIAITRLEDQ